MLTTIPMCWYRFRLETVSDALIYRMRRTSIPTTPLPLCAIRTETAKKLVEFDHRKLRRETCFATGDTVVSVISLSQWIITYGQAKLPPIYSFPNESDVQDRSKHDGKHDEDETFIDARGVRRYVKNWAIVPDDTEKKSDEAHKEQAQGVDSKDMDPDGETEEIKVESVQNADSYQMTGCITKEIFCTAELDLTDTEADQKVIIPITFLNDWQRMWYSLEDDPEDAIASHMILFHSAVRFYFHDTTFRIINWLFIYDSIVTIILTICFPFPHAGGHAGTLIMTQFLKVVAYRIVSRLFKGYIPSLIPSLSKSSKLSQPNLSSEFGDQSNGSPVQSKISTQQEENESQTSDAAPVPINFHKLKWKASILLLLHLMKDEFIATIFPSASLNRKKIQSTNSNGEQIERILCFYDLLNITVKFFVHRSNLNRINHQQQETSDFNHKTSPSPQDDDHSDSEDEWDRKSYRLILLFCIFFYPLWLLIYEIFFIIDIVDYCNKHEHDNYCYYNAYDLILNGGLLFDIFINAITAGGILTSLVGIAYCGEIIFKLSDAWFEKFCCLRRLSFDQDSDKCYIVPNGSLASIEKEYAEKSSTGTANKNSLPSNRKIPKSENDAEVISALHIQTKDTSHKVKNEGFVMCDDAIPVLPPPKMVKVSTAVSGVDTSHYSDTTSSLNEEPSLQPLHTGKPVEWLEEQKKLISALIVKDATEQYLFLREIMAAADRIWSPALTALFLFAAYISVQYSAFAVIYALDNNIFLVIQIIIFILIRISVLVLYPIISISHANAYIYKLKACFLISAPTDYELLDGRSRWKELMEQTPAVWTYYGLWITWERLYGLLSTAGAGLSAYVLTMLQQYLTQKE